MKIDKYMNCLAIEMTRKCNMNCEFCAKGKAQNIDINKQLIDKTLDELEGVYIDSLRISGGEPLLVSELICYLIKKIIEKNILINNVCIFTNGQVDVNLELSNNISELLQYLKSIETPEMRKIIRWSDSFFRNVYDEVRSSKFSIIISDVGRKINQERQNKIDNMLKFFDENIIDDDFGIVKQSSQFSKINNITLEGNAKENYKTLVDNPLNLSKARILNNEYCFIHKSANLKNEKFFFDTTFIMKALTVSANGNVFPGCMMSYENVDNKFMFNITDCNNDFFERVDNYCWKHPINEKALNMRNKFLLIEFCKKHNLTVEYMSDSDYEKIMVMNLLIDKYEQFAIDIHPMLPNLDHSEIDAMATAILVNDMFEKNIGIGWIKLYLNWCTDFDENTIESVSPEWCRGFILFLSDTNNEREKHNLSIK